MAGVQKPARESGDRGGGVSSSPPLGRRVDGSDADAVGRPSGEAGERDRLPVIPDEQPALIEIAERDVARIARLVWCRLGDERRDPLDETGEVAVWPKRRA